VQDRPGPADIPGMSDEEDAGERDGCAAGGEPPEPEGPLRLRAFGHAGRWFLEARGEADVATADQLRGALEGLCAEAEAAAAFSAAPAAVTASVVVDLRGVEFLDSAGLAVLMEARRRFRNTCAVALVVTEGGQPERAVNVTHFDRFVRVVHSPGDLDREDPGGAAMGAAHPPRG